MADVITRFKLETTQFDSKLRDSAKSLSELTGKLTIAGKDFDRFASKNVEAARALGSIQSGATNTKDKVRDLVGAFNDVAKAYNQLTKEQQQTDFGKAMAGSLTQLKGRITEAKQELYSTGEATKGLFDKGGELNGLLGQIGSKLGINSQLLGVVTTGTIGATAAITASVAATVAATKAWADYNSELEKQSQITSVTTGLQGGDANRMTDAASALAQTYGVDFREVINAANTLMSQFGKTGDEAISLIADGLQGMIQGDGGKLLSMIQQYAPAFQSAGVEASQLVAVIQNSEGGIFTDQNMQAIIMALPKIKMMSESTAKALAGIGIDGQAMAKQVEDGSLTVFQALQQISQAMDDNKDKSRETAAVMQEMFGRQARTAGDNLGKAIATLNTNLEETKMQTGQLGESLAQLAAADEKFNNALRETFGYDGWESMSNSIKASLIGALSDLLEKVNDVRTAFYNISGIDVFSTFLTSTLKALGPLGDLVDKLRQAMGLMQLQGGGLASIGASISNTVSHTIANAKAKAGQGGTGGGTGTTETESEKALKAEIERLKKALTNAQKPKGGGGMAGAAWAPIEMQSFNFAAIPLGRSKEDIQKDINYWKKMDSTSLDVAGSIAAQKNVEKYERELAARKEMENPYAEFYSHNFQKDIDSLSKENKKEDKSTKDIYEKQLAATGEMVSGIQQMVGGLNQLGIEIPEGFSNMLGGLQGIITILEAIQTIQTAGAILGIFHNGGLVKHAASGYMVPGNDYSDNTPVLVSSGELILNRAQQNSIAGQLTAAERGGGGYQGTPYVDGENIFLGVNNYLRRSGRGEIVTRRR